MHHTMTAATDTGSVRRMNQDCVCIVPELDVAVLADGLGGHQAGEIASRMSVDAITRHFGDRAAVAGAADAADQMLEAVNAANAEVYSNSRQFSHMEGMGTTVVAAHVCNGRVIIGHIGDSRCYRFRKGELAQLTEDHTLASRLLRGNPAGIVPDYSHHMLDKALGTQPLCAPDILDREVLPGDVLMLCSDGLSGVVADTEIAGILAHGSEDPESCVEGLIDACLKSGAPDNVSVILVRIR
ncbi:MAG: serine/threonine-protein phosphatase [Gammaproteobacteria bacterium]|nr:serine/threonine-protein phosphatase [Gammaproteobacteria bacterium]MYG66090.1 serine/threonine-protein phosphatase [Gammaproteobacteria bacterium]